MITSLGRTRPRNTLAVGIAVMALVTAFLVARVGDPARATSGVGPYTVPIVTDTNPDPNVVETTLVADETPVDIGGGVTANAMTYNGTIPGPEFRLVPGQRVIVHFENHLATEATGIHWHGIELANPFDGTPVTQNQVPAGDTFEYDFVAPRPGVYWYHPHHEFSTNQVFKGLYGSIIVTDPNEAELIADGVIPAAADTRTLALSDLTVCKDADPNNDNDITDSLNDDDTYDDSLPWVGGGALPEQAGPFPSTLCDTPIDQHGDPLAGPLNEGDVPNIQKHSGRVNEGQVVLTNGMQVGARAGTAEAPGALAGGASVLDVQPGQGLRLQIGNTATTRFFRLHLTDNSGNAIPLVRIGGEGGLLDDAIVEGTVPNDFEFGYPSGEILLDPGDRADVVAAFPSDASGVATLWTEDFKRTGGGDGGGGWANIPTVPVAHFNVTGSAVVPAYTISAGIPLRSATGDLVPTMPPANATLLDPSTFTTPQPGMASQDIQLTANGAVPSINGVQGTHDFTVDFTQQPIDDSTRWAHLGDSLELTVTNTTQAHHPFHLHGFSIQPLSYNNCTDNSDNPLPVPSFTFPEHEFIDTIDMPGKCTLTYRVQIHDRPFPDGTPGGGLGRWVFHCHIFFHHHQGMTSEVIVVGPEVTVTAPPSGSLYPVGSVVDVSADVVGNGPNPPEFDWDDGTAPTAGTPAGGVTYTASHQFTQAGVFTVEVTAENNGVTDSDTTMIVVFDPSAGFVTGGGSIESPSGAYFADPSLSGDATFGFVSKYKKGATVPQGETEFKFQAGDLRFSSVSYEWLVVAGAKAQYKGIGTVNGAGNYGFLLTATDGQLSGGGGVDKFRLKVTDNDNGGALVYDNALGSPEDIDVANPQAISGGSIVVHKAK
jgi:FtsP/CotA-like multicopper oxidase with cupredoxin domain